MAQYYDIYAFHPSGLDKMKTSAEKYEKNIYSQLCQLNGIKRPRITSNNTVWKDDLKALLSLEGDYDLPINEEDVINDAYNAVVKGIGDANLLPLFIQSSGVKELGKSIRTKSFDGGKHILSDNMLKGLATEMVTSIKRFKWAKDLDVNATFENTSEYGRGAYGSELYDIAIKFDRGETINSRRMFRSEVKSNLEKFHIIGKKMDQALIDMLLKDSTMRVVGDKLHLILKKTSLEEMSETLLASKYLHEGNYPIFEDGHNIKLFSEIVESLKNDKYLIDQIENYNLRQNYNSMDITPATFKQVIGDSIKKQSAKFNLWYGSAIK